MLTKMLLTNKDYLVDLLLINSPFLHWYNFIDISNCLDNKHKLEIEVKI